MAHPSRVQSAHALALQLGAPVTMDTNEEGPWECARRAWLACLSRGESHCLVVQDDVTLCADFSEHVERVISARPDSAIVLYLVRPSAQTAINKGLRWVRVRRFGTPALIVPSFLVERMIEHGDALGMAERYGQHDDWRISDFLWSAGVDAFATSPRLVDHGSMPSIMHNEVEPVTIPFQREIESGWTDLRFFDETGRA